MSARICLRTFYNFTNNETNLTLTRRETYKEAFAKNCNVRITCHARDIFGTYQELIQVLSRTTFLFKDFLGLKS